MMNQITVKPKNSVLILCVGEKIVEIDREVFELEIVQHGGITTK